MSNSWDSVLEFVNARSRLSVPKDIMLQLFHYARDDNNPLGKMRVHQLVQIGFCSAKRIIMREWITKDTLTREVLGKELVRLV